MWKATTGAVLLALAVSVAGATETGTRDHWCGYAVATSLTAPQDGAVCAVGGSWTVPTVAPGTNGAKVLIWVGIDSGITPGTTVQQVGTGAIWATDHAEYYAWYQLWPQSSATVIRNFTVAAGDAMSGEVKHLGAGKYGLTLRNLTRSKTWSKTVTSGDKPKNQSAEWIVEPPSTGNGTRLPLANFGTVQFTNCWATLNGHTGPIDDPAGANLAITLQENATGTVKAVPSALGAGGDSFTVTWLHE